MSASWEASAVQIAGLLKQARARGLADQALAKCAPEVRAVYANPYAARWHPGDCLALFCDALIEVSDAATLEEMNYAMTRDSFSPILKPMVQVAMTLTGRTPATLLARMGSAVGPVIRNVTFRWEPKGERGGTLVIDYPTSVSGNSLYAWRGGLRFMGELVGHPLRVELASHHGPRLDLSISW